tara:strand:+ start:700 stop:1788 length:1089 start_codon:yes stop_codon:yes gene_type:complete
MKKSPIKQNNALIRGAGVAANTFTDVQGGYNAGMARTGISEAAMMGVRNALYKERQDEAELKNYVNSMSDIDVSKITPSMRDEVNAFLIKNRNEYADAAKIASELDAGEEGYTEAVSTMNRVNNAFKSLSGNLDTFKKQRDQYYSDVDNNLISDASLASGNIAKLNSLYKNDDYEIVIDPYGSFTVFNDGDYVPLESFSDDSDYNYHLKNVKGFDEVMKLTNAVHKNGVKLEGGSRDIVSRNLSILFNNMGREDLLSMAYDNMLDSTIPVFQREDFEDGLLEPENERELRTYLHKTYLGGLEKVGLTAYNTKRSDYKKQIRNSYNKKVAGKLIIDPSEPLTAKQKVELMKILTKKESLPPGK